MPKDQQIDPATSLRLQQLVAEVDGSRPAAPASGLVRFACFGLLCLGLGFWAGAEHARLRWSGRQPSEREVLAAQGWRQDGTGVFYRWCNEPCHVPRLYGGGVIKAFDVKCVDRPCGDIQMAFNVLDAKGAVLDQLTLSERGVRGETRRFLVESQRPEAASLELREFSARARVEG
jgi:hypothetical protein